MEKKKKNTRKIKKIFKIESSYSLVEVVIFVLISIVFGMIAGCILTYRMSSISSIRMDSHLREIVSTYTSIKNHYYKKVNDEDLTNAAIKGMIDSLNDPNSIYFDSTAAGSFNESVDGKFVGIGISILLDGDYYKIVSVNKDGPADKAGIKENDVIIEVDGHDCKGLTSSDLSGYIRGEKNTKVAIKVKREEEELTFTVIRNTIQIQSVYDKFFEKDGKKIGYIGIETFASNTYDQFLVILNQLEKKDIDSLIIDVRGNPGGHIDQSRRILDLLLPKKTVLFRIKDGNKLKKVYAVKKKATSYPIAILMNKGTASAAEVLVSSLHENYKDCTIIGITSYGKGTIQKSQNLSNGNSYKYTIERWLTPSGIDINGTGIEPDIEVSLNMEYFEDYLEEHDNQLQTAIDVLKES
ncbi:MAG: S41 family peptidase [Bacilli bacterium]|nr:S41 family peptidase [Bacilli bacterium]